MLAVAGPAIAEVRGVFARPFIPLKLADESLGLTEQMLITLVRIGLAQADDGQAGFIIRQQPARRINAAVRLDERFQTFQALGYHGIASISAAAQNRGGHQRGHARHGLTAALGISRLTDLLKIIDGAPR